MALCLTLAWHMHPQFWHTRWAKNQIGFHESAVNPLLVAHVEVLGVPRGARFFLPLCGKTLDIGWLLSRGYKVAGVELSPLAVAQLFDQLGARPVVSRVDGLERHSADGVDVFVGDIFDLPAHALGSVDAVYDRAALIALPPAMRRHYTQHMQRLAGNAPHLLVTLDYDQAVVEGPPFSVPAAEVAAIFTPRMPVLVSSQQVPGGLKGKCPATENAWIVD